ncbi:AraC family transcriptional regulator [Ottowia thiooxydans]|uniref:AraC family transcriptional regulator n=1 Tax=Ottowia thiooxydans TaxID=219182 RepID=UPI001FDFB386|nr:AraC family transcriptional regulator [Ottowia thiooxydans]
MAFRFAESHADRNGVARTPIPGVTVILETAPGALQFAINRPLVALVLQGRKRVVMGHTTFEFGAGESLLITTDVPTVSEITAASAAAPYVSIVLDLDITILESLVVEMGAAPWAIGQAVRVDPTGPDVADCARRLMALLERPASLGVLQTQLLRELHYWLLTGEHAGAIRALGVVDSHAQRIGRAVARIREDYAQVLDVEQLAAIAGMSISTFHEHFRSITSLTPIQLQKRFRLIEARRRLLSEGLMVAHAAHSVGYESIPQFTRDYGRLFGMSPAREVRTVRLKLTLPA